MLCEKCGKLPAGVHFSQNINGEQSEFHVCANCAAQLGYWGASSLFGKSFWGPINQGAKSRQSCPSCGQTYEQLNNQKRMGCERCYSHFAEVLDPLIKKIQLSTTHVGKIPKGASPKLKISRELDSLKSGLAEAIRTEDYEKAAALRDKIREIEGLEGKDAK